MHKNLIVLTLQPKYEFTKIDYIIQSDPSAYNTQDDISSCWLGEIKKVTRK